MDSIMTLKNDSEEYIEEFRRKSIKKTCPNCSSYIKTEVSMCCLPYYVKWFKTAEHYCPICDVLLGKYPNE
ncbi:hypothetical protein J437_LFUL003864 [Ladona fulva]|uniref:LITAF domain-containing protein n=1 Tax=Ladona fulva TaxID=123851 RepID=A0A8K0K4V1_LADFU|nr:hypothetical protein J437_LFUL003864 [Ladona fulva]